jgi:hypothetical protein
MPNQHVSPTANWPAAAGAGGWPVGGAPCTTLAVKRTLPPSIFGRPIVYLFTRQAVGIGFAFYIAFVSYPAICGVYKCTNAEGEVYFSDIACPANFDKKEMRLDRPAANSQTQTEDYNPYSVAEQVRRIEERERQQRRHTNTSNGSQRPSAGGHVDRARLGSIEEQLRKVEKEIADLRSGLNRQSGIRARWTREKLAEARLKRTQLLRERENVLGIPSAPRERSEEYHARSQAAEHRARLAEERARQAEQRAQQIEADAQAPRYDPQTDRWCQQIGGTLNCW